MTKPDHGLKARLDEYLRHENFHETNDDLTDRACGDAYRANQLITLSDHEAAVKAAVDAEREACVAICQQEAENSVKNGFPDRERGLEIAAAAIRTRANGGE